MGRTKFKKPSPKANLLGFGGDSNSFGGHRNVNRNKNGQFVKKIDKMFTKRSLNKVNITPILNEIKGARLVDIEHLQQQMICTKCQKELSVRAITDETSLGLASVLSVECQHCAFQNKIQTSKRNPDGSYNINIAAVLGSHDAGIGNTQMRAFLSTMNSPSMTLKSFEKIERRVGPRTIELAQSTCYQAIVEEKDCSMRLKSISICDFCNEMLFSKEEAEKHIQLHLEKLNVLETQEVCGICSELIQSSKFEDHIQAHCSLLDHPFICQFCSKVYQLRHCLVRHLLNQHLLEYSRLMKEEQIKCLEKPDTDCRSAHESVGITGSSDGCWLKRGNGFSHDSHAGFVSVMGQETGKVLAYRVKQNYCRRCALLGKHCNDPSCCKNWSGSSKSMESGAVVEMVAKNSTLVNVGVNFEQLVCDGDSSVGAGIRAATNGACMRVADVTHTLKHLSNNLYSAKSKQLTSPVIDYLKRMAGFAIKTNKNNPPAIVEALTSIPYHAFGMHSKCSPTWCKRQESDGSWSKHLDGPIDSLGSITFETNFDAVSKAFGKLSEKAAELAPNGSTQQNESLNAIVTSKAPKRIDFASSNAITFRCAAAVLQKNIGVAYTTELRKLNKMSPGKWTHGYKTMLAKERAKTALKRRSPIYKKRRRELNFVKKNRTTRIEAIEGPTYKKGLHLLTKVAAPPKLKTKKFIPQSMRQQVSKISTEEIGNCALVFFDTETTGLGVAKSEIIQISAKCESSTFNCFVKPRRGIRSVISELTGISIERGKLYHKNKPVPSKDIKSALIDFLNYLESLQPGKVILVAHNAKFDLRFVLHALEATSLTARFLQVCVGFICTLSLAEKKLPKSAKGPVDHKISGLLEFYYGEVIVELHDSVTDVLALESIFHCMSEGLEELVPHSFNVSEFWAHQKTGARAKGMTALMEVGMTSLQLTKLASALSFQDIYSLTSSGYDSFQNDLLKISPTFSSDLLKSTFEFLVGRYKH